MSLLERGDGYEPCVVYPEVSAKDGDGNTIVRASTTGIPTKARFQVQVQSGTSSRRAEQMEGGFETEQVYTVRFTNKFTAEHGELGTQTIIEWGLDSRGRPAKYNIFGDVQRYGNSRRTRHVAYMVRRA